MRSDGFSMILSGELEVIQAVPSEGDEEDGYDGEGGNDGGYGGAYMDDIEEEGQYPTVPTQHPNVQMHLEEMDDQRVAAMLKNINPFAHNIPSPPSLTASSTGGGLAHILPRPSMVAPYDNSTTALYEQTQHHANHHPHQGHNQHHAYTSQGTLFHDPQEKMHWNNMYTSHHQQQMMHQQQQQMIQAQRSLYTPPSTSHGLPPNSNPCSNPTNGVGSHSNHSLPSPPHSGSGSPPHHSSSSSSMVSSSASFAPDGGYAFSNTSQPVPMRRRRSGSSATSGSGYVGSPTGYGGSYAGSPAYAASPSGYGGSYTGSPPCNGNNAGTGGDSPTYELAIGQGEYGVGVPRRGAYIEMGMAGLNGMQQQQVVVGGMMM
jgi:hypothetical protein